MAGPLGVLLVGLAAPTTKAVEDVDGGPPGGCCRWVRQRPPPKWDHATTFTDAVAGGSGSDHHFHCKASMADPLGDAASRTDSNHHCLVVVVVVGVDVIDGSPPWEAIPVLGMTIS
jgi:hypothetical protein